MISFLESIGYLLDLASPRDSELEPHGHLAAIGRFLPANGRLSCSGNEPFYTSEASPSRVRNSGDEEIWRRRAAHGKVRESPRVGATGATTRLSAKDAGRVAHYGIAPEVSDPEYLIL